MKRFFNLFRSKKKKGEFYSPQFDALGSYTGNAARDDSFESTALAEDDPFLFPEQDADDL